MIEIRISCSSFDVFSSVLFQTVTMLSLAQASLRYVAQFDKIAQISLKPALAHLIAVNMTLAKVTAANLCQSSHVKLCYR